MKSDNFIVKIWNRLFRINQLILAWGGYYDDLDWSTYDKYFVVSTGRTGTAFLANFFNQFSDLLALHEPYPDFYNLGVEFARREKTKAEVIKKIKFGRKPVLGQLNKYNNNRYLEANNRLFSLIEPIKKNWPGSKFVHIVRDGRAVVRSGMSRHWYTFRDPCDRLKATDFPDDEHFSSWNEMSRFEKICWWWRKKDSIIADSLAENDSWIRIKYEEIFYGSHAGLDKMLDFLNMDERISSSIFDKRVNSTSQYSIPHWENWNESMKSKFWRIAGDHMDKYGYKRG